MHGLNLEPVSQLGIITLLWRAINVNGEVFRVLQIHIRSPLVRRAILELLPAFGCDKSKLQVLDVRDNSRADGIKAGLGGTLADAVAEIDEPAVPDDRASFSARAGRDLSEPGAKFADYSHYPGRGRTIHCKVDGYLLRFKITQVDYSVVFSQANLEHTDVVFREAVNVGSWISYP